MSSRRLSWNNTAPGARKPLLLLRIAQRNFFIVPTLSSMFMVEPVGNKQDFSIGRKNFETTLSYWNDPLKFWIMCERHVTSPVTMRLKHSTPCTLYRASELQHAAKQLTFCVPRLACLAPYAFRISNIRSEPTQFRGRPTSKCVVHSHKAVKFLIVCSHEDSIWPRARNQRWRKRLGHFLLVRHHFQAFGWGS